MNFFIEYFKLIDLLALAALAALACAALVRNGSVWLFVAGFFCWQSGARCGDCVRLQMHLHRRGQASGMCAGDPTPELNTCWEAIQRADIALLPITRGATLTNHPG